MQYICYTDYKGKSLSGDVDIKKGELLELDDRFLMYNNKPICVNTSYISHRFFAQNDDNNGLERGRLIYLINYSDRNAGNGFRFSDEEQEMFRNEYKHLLKDPSTIIFNHDFYNLDIDTLQEIVSKLKLQEE